MRAHREAKHESKMVLGSPSVAGLRDVIQRENRRATTQTRGVTVARCREQPAFDDAIVLRTRFASNEPAFAASLSSLAMRLVDQWKACLGSHSYLAAATGLAVTPMIGCRDRPAKSHRQQARSIWRWSCQPNLRPESSIAPHHYRDSILVPRPLLASRLPQMHSNNSVLYRSRHRNYRIHGK